ncbi:MAG: binding-protein-dependent transport system inner rane component [Tardiphaga sp.]|nr:binding-protein-dependent transport system inner rane component [Tardiphaga sp.]
MRVISSIEFADITATNGINAVSNIDYVIQQEYVAAARVAPTPRIAVARKPSLLLLSWIAPIILVIVWETLARAGWLSPQVLPAPSKVLLTAWKLTLSGSLLNDLGVSMLRAAAGFAIGGSIGFALGTIVGFSRIAEALIDRSVQMVRAIPFLALVPLVIVWFGVGEAQKIFLVSLGVAFPIYINTTLGIRQIDPKLVELGRVQGLDTWQLIRRIILPGALPSILTGVRYSLATAWLALVVAETIGAQSGLGFLAMDAREFLRTDVIVLTIVIYALIGVAADSMARLLERRLLAWHPNYARGAR